MNLPGPREKKTGCMWLPRILAKARLHTAGLLPPEYEMSFLSLYGVDGQFMAFFSLDKEQVMEMAALANEDIGEYFTALPGCDPQQVAKWNRIAENLGRPGFPMEGRIALALAQYYKNVDPTKVETVFDILEADEKLGRFEDPV